MDLRYAPEHALLRDTAARFLRQHYDYQRFQQRADSALGWSPELWAEFATLGWLGLPFAEEYGGSGGGALEVAILMEEFGRALVLEPYVTTVVMGGGLIAALGTPAQQAAMLPPIIEGKHQVALAYDGANMPVIATPAGRSVSLSGEIKGVLAASSADTLLLPARLPEGLGIFIVAARARGLTVRPHRTVDGHRAADLAFADVQAERLGDGAPADAALAGVTAHAIAALSADAVGAISAMVAQTVEYAKTRVQFGQPIAKFQVIQHRLVQLKIREEEARASSLLATLSLDGAALQRTRAVSGAKAKIGRCARFVAQDAIQLHGAIGTTSELPLGAYAKRLVAYEARFGTTREHARRYGTAIVAPGLADAGLLLEA